MPAAVGWGLSREEGPPGTGTPGPSPLETTGEPACTVGKDTMSFTFSALFGSYVGLDKICFFFFLFCFSFMLDKFTYFAFPIHPFCYFFHPFCFPKIPFLHTVIKVQAKIRESKAKQIKLIVSQAFFLGKPMRDAAFFFFFCKPQAQLVCDQNHKHPIVEIKLTHAGSFLFMLEDF